MVADLLFRVACNGGSEEALNVHLKRIAESAYTRKSLGGTDILGELLAPVIAESHDADSRKEIMRYIRECLSEPNGKRWHRIYGGLALVDSLMHHGSPALIIETSHGYYFDLVQKVSFLEHFDAAARGCTDKRAQNVLRSKASELRAKLVPQLQKASTEVLPQGAGFENHDNKSNCSFGGMSTATGASGPNTSSSSSTVDTATGEMLSVSESVGSPSEPGTPNGVRTSASALSMTVFDGVFDGASVIEEATTDVDTLLIEEELTRLTDSVQDDAFTSLPASVVEASHDGWKREVVMAHLRSGLMETSPAKWRRVYNSLLIVEALINYGSPTFCTESARSLRFNMPQQIWFLQQFEHRPDWRAQQKVRKKACDLHDLLIQKILSPDPVCVTQDSSANLDNAFAALRTWVDTAGSSAPSSRSSSRLSGTFSTASYCTADDSDSSSSSGWVPLGGSRAPCSKSCDNESDGNLAFFTPMPAPAVPTRAAQLISL